MRRLLDTHPDPVIGLTVAALVLAVAGPFVVDSVCNAVAYVWAKVRTPTPADWRKNGGL